MLYRRFPDKEDDPARCEPRIGTRKEQAMCEGGGFANATVVERP